ncbi:MAG TPA: hypothetical protein VHG93_03335 [Longimicrobium sp.]|nr:hypothetical protein [Longimicrobium sp.]
MTKKSMLLAGAAMLLSAAATPAQAQSTIAPGMTTEQVRDRFGAPATTRAQGDWTYWYYLNGCPISCGSDDVVFFQNDRVVAAVLRTARRRFAGPAPDDALGRAAGVTANDGRLNDAPAGRARVGGVRVDDADRARPRAREGQPGEPSTIIITQPDAPASQNRPPVPVNEAREGRPGEPSTIIINTPPAQAEPQPATGTNPPAVDGPLPGTADAEPANPAENTEAADARGETSIDRKNRRNVQDRANEPTATERARRNDARNP